MNKQIAGILHKLVNGIDLSISEQKDLDEWLSQSDDNRHLYEEVMNKENFHQEVKEILEYDGKNLWEKINRQLPEPPALTIPFFRNRGFLRYAAAVVLVALISTTIYIFFVKPTHPEKEVAGNQTAPAKNDVAPGTERALLVLDNGTELVLDHTSNGKIAEEGNAIIIKEDGLLAYNADAREISPGKVFYNRLSTPKAGYYPSLVLADGSKVWLDAASSIYYPTSFPGKERIVEVSGQVYFEVAKNAHKPFKVKVKDSDMEVEVLGTHFNINSYKDEGGIRTSLLEGAVRVTLRQAQGDKEVGNRKSEVVIEPGEQAVAMNNGKLKVESDVDLEEVTAWKNGNFLFNKEDLATIMRQVARWYDVEVEFKDEIPEYFVASLPRNVSVSQLLKIFEMAGGVRFEIDNANKKITVRKP